MVAVVGAGSASASAEQLAAKPQLEETAVHGEELRIAAEFKIGSGTQNCYIQLHIDRLAWVCGHIFCTVDAQKPPPRASRRAKKI